MNKQVKFNEDARQSIKAGIDTLANAVKVTLGPFGKNAVIQTVDGLIITKDGATVADSIKLKDEFENLGVQIINAVAEKTCKEVGDNTTTSTILTQSIIDNGFEFLKQGYNPLNLKRGIEKAVEVVIKNLPSIPATKEHLKNVASVSANDETIGSLVADVFDQVGINGKINIENGANGFEVDIVKGISFDKGFCHPSMVTDQKKMINQMEDCPVLILDKKVEEIKDIVPVLEKMQGKNILIIAEDFDDKVINTLVLNKVKGGFNAVAVKAPSFGEGRKNILEDLKYFLGDGFAKKVIVKKDETIIIGGDGDVTKRIEQLNGELEQTKSDFEKEKLKERIAKLTGGIGIIKVGLASEIETGEVKDRIEDAIFALRAAYDGGIVEGGGCALIRTLKFLDEIQTNNLGELNGVEVIRRAIQAPIKQLLLNAGKGEDVLERVIAGEGYSSKTDTFVDLIEEGIIDTYKGIKTALINASSAASTFLTTEVVIAHECSEKTIKTA